MSFTSRLTRLMDQRTTRIMEKEIIDFNIDTISKILMYLKNYHVIAEMYLLYLLLGQLSRVDVNIYIYEYILLHYTLYNIKQITIIKL